MNPIATSTTIHSAATRPARALCGAAAAALLALLLLTVQCRAQMAAYNRGHEAWRVGVEAGFQLLSYTAAMTGLPGVPSCCPEYRTGTGSGVAAGIFGRVSLYGGLYTGLRLSYAAHNGTLTATEHQLVTAERDTTTATISHTITLTQPAVAAEAFVGYEPFSQFSMEVGFRADLMTGGTYRQTEQIESPATIRFENGSRQRLMYDGAIPQERTMYGALTLGVRYDLPLNRDWTWMLTPELSAWQGLGTLVDGVDLRMRGVRMGLGLGFVTLSRPDGPSPLEPGPSPQKQQ